MNTVYQFQNCIDYDSIIAFVYQKIKSKSLRFYGCKNIRNGTYGLIIGTSQHYFSLLVSGMSMYSIITDLDNTINLCNNQYMSDGNVSDLFPTKIITFHKFNDETTFNYVEQSD